MITFKTAHTHEIDDAALAVSEILEQLDLEHNKRKHAAGILTCYTEFMETGVVKALCDALPFDVVGCTTLGIATAGQVGPMLLSLTMLTSDDVSFTSSITPSLFDEQVGNVTAGYAAATAGREGKPGLILAFAPLINHVGGELLVDTLDSASCGVPVFGTLGCDHNPDYRDTHAIHNGVCYPTAMALLLLWGDVHPRFLIASISEEKTQKEKAIITASDGNILQAVNGMPLLQYLKTLGIAQGNGIEGMNAVPLIVDYNDGSKPVARAIYLITGDGHAVCGAAMPVDATLAIGSIDHDDVMRTSREAVRQALAQPDVSGMLMFSCLSRCYVLGADTMAELEGVRDLVPEGLPYHVCYSGGEICPVYTPDGQTINRFHNFTYIVCIL